MPRTLRCPSCNSPNDPDERLCRVCHAVLHPPAEQASPDVRLERVLRQGSYHLALQDTAPSASEDDEPPEDERGTRSERSSDEMLNPVVVLADRIAARAADTGQRFKPYTADRPRRAQTAEARKAVVKQLESAARSFRERRFDVAIGHLLKAIAKEDGDPRSWILLGEAYLRLERPYKAAVGYLRALSLDPANDNAWLGLGRTLRSMGDLAGALEVLDHTLQTNPAITEAWSERGIVLEGLARPLDAAKSFQKALELRPDHPAARTGYDRLAQHVQESAAESASAPAAPEADVSAPPAAPAAEETEEDELPDFGDLSVRAPPQAAPASPEVRRIAPRVSTFVDGLDDVLGGGIPAGHIVVVEGSPGSMKSSLVFSIMARNAAGAGLRCAYLSLGERASGLLKRMASLGLPTRSERGSLAVLDARTAKGLFDERKTWIEGLQAALDAVRGPDRLDLLAIDSLDALEVLAKFQDRRRDVYRLFEWLRDQDVTTFVIAERPDRGTAGDVARFDEDFLADGLLHLRQHLVSDHEAQRRIRVIKMRGAHHVTGYLGLSLEDGRFRVSRLPG